MHDRRAIYLFLLFINILYDHRHRSGFEGDPVNPLIDIRLDNMRPNQILGRRGTEPRAQGSGRQAARPMPPLWVQGLVGFDAWSGFDVRTDHPLIIHRSGRSQGRTLTSVCVCVNLSITSHRDGDGRGQLQTTRLIHPIGPPTQIGSNAQCACAWAIAFASGRAAGPARQ